jgi:methyl-accepting chemotaxis protein
MADSISQLAKSIDKMTAAHSEGLKDIAKALQSIAHYVSWLGNGDAVPRMGGLEALGAVIKESTSDISSAMNEIAMQIREQNYDAAVDDESK